MSAVVSAISWMVAKVFSDNFLRYLATKALLVTLVVVILPILLNNLIYDLLEIVQNVVASQLSNVGISGQALSITGVGAWLFSTCKIGESFSVITSAIVVRSALNCIPFIRL